MQAIRRPLSSIFRAKKTVTYGLSISRHAELPVPVHRRFTTFASGESLRYASPAQHLRRVHVRTISYSSIPISILRAFRVSITVALVGAGIYWYVCYKFEELKRWTLARLNNLLDVILNYVLKVVGFLISEVRLPGLPETWLNDAQVTATNIFKSATNGLKDVGSRIQEVELPDISETGAVKFIKDLFGGQQHKEGDGESEGSEDEREFNMKPPTDKAVVTALEGEKPPAWLKAVEGTANDILELATNGLNDVGSRIQDVKLPDISETWAGKFIKNLFGGQQHKEGGGESEGSEGEQQSDKKPPTDVESELVDKEDKPPSAQ
ncbi:hypothetical protein ARMGADRAFT_1157919 [Armillaria gallica]|uniref:Uncharacterized protein n=1 Tax=Armillaria gallica TaxID=47427 RepID=A0A2H3EKV0_ARMGA|nr:hypothetical protein ARMGADRAFT_1157919 [Armillaria gallica]